MWVWVWVLCLWVWVCGVLYSTIMTAAGGGMLSCVDIESASLGNIDKRPIVHLLLESRRELHATVNRNLLRLWQVLYTHTHTHTHTHTQHTNSRIYI